LATYLWIPPKDLHIVNISGMGGFQRRCKSTGLSAGSNKAALACLADVLAEEFAG